MALSANIANGFVTIAVKGMKELQAQLSQISQQFNKTAQAAGAINQVVSNTFSQSTSLIKSLVAAADPLGFLQFEIAIQRVSIQLGRIFVPLLRQVTEYIRQFADYLNGMSDSTRESILNFTKWGLALSGSVVVGGKLIGIVAGITSTFGNLIPLITGAGTAFWRILGFLGPWGRLVTIIGGVVAAIVGLNSASGSAEGTFGKIVSYATKAWNGLVSLWDSLVSAITPVWDSLSEMVGSVLDVISAKFMEVWKVISKIWGVGVEEFSKAFAQVLPVFEKLFGTIWGIVQKVFDNIKSLLGGFSVGELDTSSLEKFRSVFAGVFGFIAKYVADFYTRINNLWEGLFPIVERYGSVVIKIWSAAFSAFQKYYAAIYESISKVAQKLSPLFDMFNSGGNGDNFIIRLIDGFVTLAEIATPIVVKVFGTMADLAANTIGILTDGFAYVVDYWLPIIKSSWDKINEGSKAAIELLKSGFAVWVKGFETSVNVIVKALNALIVSTNALISAANALNSVNPLVPKIGLVDTIKEVKFTRDEPGEGHGGDFGGEDEKKKGPPLGNFAPKSDKPEPKGKDAPQGKGFSSQDKDNKFAGQILGQVKITGLVEAMRAAQQATVPTRESSALEEIARTQSKTADNTERTVKALEKIVEQNENQEAGFAR